MANDKVFYEGLATMQPNGSAVPVAIPQPGMNAQGDRKCYFTFNPIDRTQNIQADCAGVTFYNQGTSIAVINYVLQLQPNRFISLNLNEKEVDSTNYNVAFIGPGSNNCIVIRKNYQ